MEVQESDASRAINIYGRDIRLARPMVVSLQSETSGLCLIKKTPIRAGSHLVEFKYFPLCHKAKIGKVLALSKFVGIASN